VLPRRQPSTRLGPAAAPPLRPEEATVLTKSPATYYDSDLIRRPVVTEFRNFWDYRGLIRLLVVRDLIVRYKRSILGVWWTLLNPILQTAVMWLVFSQVFERSARGDIPFIVYLLSGITLVQLFTQGVVATGSSILGSRNLLVKVYVPPEVFSLAASLTALVNFAIMLVPLFALELILGVGVPVTAILVWIPAVAMLALVAGLGLMLAAAAVHFYDVIDLAKVLAQLMTWMVPTFYTLAMIPEEFHPIIKANPLYSYLAVFRGFAITGLVAPLWNFAVMVVTSVLALGIGVWVFSRSWRSLVARL
jgi:ABC-type polysaccharide/polyol phosphate export permease